MLEGRVWRIEKIQRAAQPMIDRHPIILPLMAEKRLLCPEQVGRMTSDPLKPVRRSTMIIRQLGPTGLYPRTQRKSATFHRSIAIQRSASGFIASST